MFGFIPLPKLSQSSFQCSLHLYYVTLLFLVLDHKDSVLWSFMTCLSCLLWISISGSLWAEESLCYHREVLATVVHIYLALWQSSLRPAQFGFTAA